MQVLLFALCITAVFSFLTGRGFVVESAGKMHWPESDDMTAIPIEVSTEQLICAVERLPQHELETFIAQIVALRAQCTTPHLSQDETALLLQINASISSDVPRRFNELAAKRQAATITPSELTALIQITNEIAQRLATLIELAQLRQITVPLLMDALGIRLPAHA
jgi:hypothetical protein